jgi:Resolvase, N terminal domain
LRVKEIDSGASQWERREKLLEAARRREIDVVLVWWLDRRGRSVTDLLATLQELEHLGVGFVSVTEALDLTRPAGRAMAGLLAVFADYAEFHITDMQAVPLLRRCGFAKSRPPHRHFAVIRKTPSSKGRSFGSESALAWPTLARTATAWAGR